jgi:putative flippase GtrA
VTLLKARVSETDTFGHTLVPLRASSQSRIVRFLFVGALGTAFSYAVYAALLFVGINYAVANFGALIAGILFSFKMQGTFVFENPDNRLIGRFVLCWLSIYGANVMFIRAMIARGWDGYIAGALAVPPIAVLSYITQRFFVFRREATAPPSRAPEA